MLSGVYLMPFVFRRTIQISYFFLLVDANRLRHTIASGVAQFFQPPQSLHVPDGHLVRTSPISAAAEDSDEGSSDDDSPVFNNKNHTDGTVSLIEF